MSALDCIIINCSASRLWGDRALSKQLLRSIADNPGKLIQTGATRPVKISRESLIVEQEWPAGDRTLRAAVKQYRARNFWKGLTAILRTSKAMQNWQKAEFLLSRHIATPRPLVACRPHGWTTSSTSFLATEWIIGAENVHLFGWRIAERPLESRLRAARRCAIALGRLLGRIHAAGATHRDLKAANLLVVEETCETIAYLVDLDGLQLGKQVRGTRQARDLARLAAGLAAHPWVTRSTCRHFLRAYLDETKTQDIDWKQLWRAIAKETAAYVGRKQKRGERVL